MVTSLKMLSGADRLAKARPLTLKSGGYIFRVTNKNVPTRWVFGCALEAIARSTLSTNCPRRAFPVVN